MREDLPKSKGCVTHAAIQLALPPNQNGYLTCAFSQAFLRESAPSCFDMRTDDMMMSIDLL
jgi:hypothetical protein